MKELPPSTPMTTFFGHARLTLRRAFDDFKFGRDMVLGGSLAVGTLVLQVWWKLIPLADWREHSWQWIGSVVIPFVLVFGIDCIRRVVAGPWMLYRKQELELREVKQQLAEKAESSDEGPDLSLDWRISGKGIGNWDIVQLRNIGTDSAFNIGLTFSWPELLFSLGFEINLLHTDKEIEKEAHFVEKTSPNHQNMGRMQTILESDDYVDRQPLEAIARFFDKDRKEFEKAFTLELQDFTHEIKVTPGKRKTVQAAS